MAKILIIDDDQGVIELLRKRLEAHGYDVLTASDGARGLALARGEGADLIVLDVVMPGLDGFSLVREIRADQALQDVPILVVTARGELEDLFRMEGVSAFIVKPFQMEAVLVKVAALLGA